MFPGDCNIRAQRKYFGTDGIRGKVGEAPITPDFIMKLGWAAGRVLAQRGHGPVLIGKDTRISGYMFESALEAGLSAAGVDIRLLGPMPTPGIAYLTRHSSAQAGIVISASHNPYYDNGIKFFCAQGRKLPDELEQAIERELDRPLHIAHAGKLGKARRITDAPRRYINFCKGRIGADADLSGLYIIVDCAHGAAYRIAPKVFAELGARVEVIGAEPDGLNINAGYGATRPAALCRAVLERQADLGIALDGDADRLIMVDHSGAIVDGDEVLYLIAKSITRARRKVLGGGVVGTQMSNLGLEQAIEGMNLGFHRARVGDRYVMEMLLQNDLILGGESSGHIINLNMTSTGDGIISALQVLEAIVSVGESLHSLKSGMHKYPQQRLNIELDEPVDLAEHPGLSELVRAAEEDLGAAGRVLLRPSGTEPVLRLMVEGDDEQQVDALVHGLAQEIQSSLRAWQ